MTFSSWRLFSSAIASVLFVGCATAGTMATSPQALWLQPWAPPPGQVCSVQAEEPLPALDAVFDSARVMDASGAISGPGAALIAVRITPPPDGGPRVRVAVEDWPPRWDSLTVVEATLPQEATHRLREALYSHIRLDVDAGFLLRVDVDPAPRFRQAHSLWCPPALRNRATITGLVRAAGHEGHRGTVVIQLLVRADGSVGPVVVERSSGDLRTDRAMLEIAREMRFHPALLDHVPVRVATQLPLTIEVR